MQEPTTMRYGVKMTSDDWDDYLRRCDEYHEWLYASDPFAKTPNWSKWLSALLPFVAFMMITSVGKDFFRSSTYREWESLIIAVSCVISAYVPFLVWVAFVVQDGDDTTRAWVRHLKVMKQVGFYIILAFVFLSFLMDLAR